MTGDFRKKYISITELFNNIDKYDNQDFKLFGGKIKQTHNNMHDHVLATYEDKTNNHFITITTPKDTINGQQLHSLLDTIKETTQTYKINVPKGEKIIQGQKITLPEKQYDYDKSNDLSNEDVTIINPEPDEDFDIEIRTSDNEVDYIGASLFYNKIDLPAYQGRFNKESKNGDYLFTLEEIILPEQTFKVKTKEKN